MVEYVLAVWFALFNFNAHLFSTAKINPINTYIQIKTLDIFVPNLTILPFLLQVCEPITGRKLNNKGKATFC